MPLHFADETFFFLVLVELASECLRFWDVNMVLEILGCQYGAGVDGALSARTLSVTFKVLGLSPL